MQIYDISRPISPTLAIWPGDDRFSTEWKTRRQRGEGVNLSTLRFSAHTGSHADAPFHFEETGPHIGDIPLEVYIGPATVVCFPRTGPIMPDDLASLDLSDIERLLVKTPNSRTPDDVWPDEIAFLHPATAAQLGRKGVRLFGTDAPSVDPLDSERLDTHHALYRGGVAILENLQLAAVDEGDYELIALPLNIPTDGCPVRAVLRRAADEK